VRFRKKASEQWSRAHISIRYAPGGDRVYSPIKRQEAWMTKAKGLLATIAVVLALALLGYSVTDTASPVSLAISLAVLFVTIPFAAKWLAQRKGG
jgi:hypothetical protein